MSNPKEIVVRLELTREMAEVLQEGWDAAIAIDTDMPEHAPPGALETWKYCKLKLEQAMHNAGWGE